MPGPGPGASAEDLFEHAPCGYLVCALDGTILRANETFARWSGHDRAALAGRRFWDLLTPAGRIYHETHYAPLLRVEGTAREIALEIVAADARRLPALITSIVHGDGGDPETATIRTAVFDASDRRRYEAELLAARRREHGVALELQRSLLSGELPSVDGAEIAVAYRPAERGLEVGGDWYDAFCVPGRSAVAVVVGDVVGRGIGAAATMGQLRSAVRALASEGHRPAEVLDALDRFSAQHAVGRMATVAYAELDLADGAVAYACAGHPPPLLVDPAGEATYLWDGRSVPVDAFFRPGPRDGGSVRLAPGASLLLYTDGLVERREHPLDHGMGQLAAEAAALAGQPLGRALETTVRRVAGAERSDDVCLLGLRRAP